MKVGAARNTSVQHRYQAAHDPDDDKALASSAHPCRDTENADIEE